MNASDTIEIMIRGNVKYKIEVYWCIVASSIFKFYYISYAISLNQVQVSFQIQIQVLFQDQYAFMIDSRYGFLIGSGVGMGSIAVPGPVWIY